MQEEGKKGYFFELNSIDMPRSDNAQINDAMYDNLLGEQAVSVKYVSLSQMFYAELLGTFLLVVIGDGSIAQMKFFGEQENFMSVPFTWGLALTIGVIVAGNVSGAHLNPAVTLAMASLNRFPFRRIAYFWAAQMIGAFLASAVVYGIYYDAIDKVDPHRTVTGPFPTAGIFATYPASVVSVWNQFITEFFGTLLLVCGVCGINDHRNCNLPPFMKPLFAGLLLMGIGNSFGYNTGFALNPARDLAPRIFTSFMYGGEVFSAYHHYFWIPVVGPLIGGIAGAWVYYGLVERLHQYS